VCLLTSTIIDNVPHAKIDIIHHRQSSRNKLNKKKGKVNFADKKQLCYSSRTFLKTKSQGMGKKSTTFWDKVDDH
jgi:hypothetical protein